MNRRESIRTLMAASAGLIALPLWAEGWVAERLPTRLSDCTITDQVSPVARAVTTTYAGDSMGALLVGVDYLLVALFGICYPVDGQFMLKKQRGALDAGSRIMHGTDFVACVPDLLPALLLC